MPTITLKKEMFKRPMRMTHRFEDATNPAVADPLGAGQTFKLRVPIVGQSHSDSAESKQQGQHEMFNPARSPVCKPAGGYASTNGPAPDVAEALAAPVPYSTKKRVGHLKTDK